MKLQKNTVRNTQKFKNVKELLQGSHHNQGFHKTMNRKVLGVTFYIFCFFSFVPQKEPHRGRLQ